MNQPSLHAVNTYLHACMHSRIHT